VLSGVPLAAIQIRRVIRGELSPFGIKSFMDASKINMDAFDKLMLVIAGLSFSVFIALLVSSR